MAHIAFVAPLYLGHLNPMCALADALVARGHRATFLHMADGAPLLARRGFAFEPLGRGTHPPGTLAATHRTLARLLGPIGLRETVRRVAATTDMLCRELPDALRALQADMVVCDQVEAAGGLVADHLGLPHVSVASALPINSEPALPPLFTPWRYDPSAWGLRRNRAGYHATFWALKPLGAVIREHAARWSLGPRRRVDHALSPWLQIAQIVPGLDFPRIHLPPTFHHCGPLRSHTEVTGTPALPSRDGRPLVYASLGSLQGSRYRLFRRFARAAQAGDFQLVLTHAGGLTREQAARLPGRPAAYDFLPQHAVLRGAAAAMLHGGLNTILDALSEGVPLVVVPVAFEQGAIAARVERAGAGLAVPRLRAGRLGATLRSVSDGAGYRTAAARLRDEIAAAGGVGRAADLVETLLRTGRPVAA